MAIDDLRGTDRTTEPAGSPGPVLMPERVRVQAGGGRRLLVRLRLAPMASVPRGSRSNRVVGSAGVRRALHGCRPTRRAVGSGLPSRGAAERRPRGTEGTRGASRRGVLRTVGPLNSPGKLLAEMNVTDPDDVMPGLPPARTFRVVVRQQADRTLVVPYGELDLASAPDLEAVLAAQGGPVVVDLGQLRFVDLAGLRVLLEADARSRQDGMNLAFIAGAAVRRLFECARLPDLLTFLDPPVA
jgi:anti-anti-sigma factor